MQNATRLYMEDIQPSRALACYRFLSLPLGRNLRWRADDNLHRPARVHHACWRRGGGMAAHGTLAAANGDSPHCTRAECGAARSEIVGLRASAAPCWTAETYQREHHYCATHARKIRWSMRVMRPRQCRRSKRPRQSGHNRANAPTWGAPCISPIPLHITRKSRHRTRASHRLRATRPLPPRRRKGG